MSCLLFVWLDYLIILSLICVWSASNEVISSLSGLSASGTSLDWYRVKYLLVIELALVSNHQSIRGFSIHGLPRVGASPHFSCHLSDRYRARVGIKCHQSVPCLVFVIVSFYDSSAYLICFNWKSTGESMICQFCRPT